MVVFFLFLHSTEKKCLTLQVRFSTLRFLKGLNEDKNSLDSFSFIYIYIFKLILLFVSQKNEICLFFNCKINVLYYNVNKK